MTIPGTPSVDVLTLEEAAGALRVSQRHLHKIMADGNGPPVVRLGRRKLIMRETLQQWLMSRESTQANG